MRFEGETKKLVGGANSSDVRTMNVATPEMPGINKILREAQMVQSSAPMREFIHGAVEMIPSNQIAYFQYPPSFDGDKESDLHRNLVKLVTGRGASKDHPRVAKSVYESLKHYPEIAGLYLNA